tara:strand:+ start:212 stop:508 length:297 start_codon:yes stop_codon:yes gene_type:complete
MANGLSKSSNLPTITIGFALAILAATWVTSAKFSDIQDSIGANQVELEDLSNRSSKYIGVSGLLTRRISDLDARITGLELKLAVLESQLEAATARDAP